MQRYAEEVRRTEVVVRAIGNDLHMDYSAVGQTTHLAARMEQLATPGSILLTAATLRLVESASSRASRHCAARDATSQGPLRHMSQGIADAMRLGCQRIIRQGLHCSSAGATSTLAVYTGLTYV
jgi:Adenylate and Guanylate cyclase catalytic domain